MWFSGWMMQSCSNDQSHVLLVGQARLLALPETRVDGEGVDRHRQVFGVHLREALAARIVPA